MAWALVWDYDADGNYGQQLRWVEPTSVSPTSSVGAAPSAPAGTTGADSGSTSGGTTGGGFASSAQRRRFDDPSYEDPYAGIWSMQNSAAEGGGNIWYGPDGQVQYSAPNFWWSDRFTGGQMEDPFSSYYNPITPLARVAPPEGATIGDYLTGIQATSASPFGMMSELAGAWRDGYVQQLPGLTPEIAGQIEQAVEQFNRAREKQSAIDSWSGMMMVAAPAIGGMLAGPATAAMGAYGPAITAGGIAAAGNLAAGGDAESALRAGTMAAAIPAGAEFLSPYLSAGWDSLSSGLASSPEATDELRRVALADAGTGMFDVAPATMPPAILDTGPVMPPAVLDTGGMMPVAIPPADPTFGGALTQVAPGVYSSTVADSSLDLDAMDAENRATLEAGDELPASEPAPSITPEDLQRYARIAKSLSGLLGGEAEGAPTRDEGEAPEQYSQELAQYLSLDPAAMAELGLQPGSPEYLDYIMQQADSVIAQVMGGLDVDAEDLAAQLRTKTQEELQALQRALYVRGQAQLLMGSGTYEDPATGTPEEVIAPGAGMFNPGVAGYQRGVARNVGELASASDPYGYLQSWLGRDADLFGMQQAADQRFEEAKRSETDELRRRRGMLTGY